MKTILKWLRRLVIALVVLVLVLLATIYVGSGRVINKEHEIPDSTFDSTAFAVDLTEGQRLATIRGCYGGCHGVELEGGVFFDEPWLARFVAPDLTQAVHAYSDTELDNVIRNGIRPNGTSTLAMPSAMYHSLVDEDLASILQFIRSQPRADGPETEVTARLLARVGLLLGEFKTQATEIAANNGERLQIPLKQALGRGDYLAQTSCTECHGNDLSGTDFAPDLRVVKAYSMDAFVQLMRDGVGLGERELELMAEVARKRFSHFTDQEVRNLHGYLSSLEPPETKTQ